MGRKEQFLHGLPISLSIRCVRTPVAPSFLRSLFFPNQADVYDYDWVLVIGDKTRMEKGGNMMKE